MEYDFEKLNVYQDAVSLTEDVYRITKDFPASEQFGVTSQLRRASMSIALNIAEGKGRYHTKVYVQFLYQARGSFYETIAILKLCQRLGYISEGALTEIMPKVNKVGVMLNNLIRAMK